MSDKGKRKDTEETATSDRVSSEGNAVLVMSSGSSSKGIQSPQSSDRDWKTYFSQSDAPLTASLLAQVSGEDSNMASTLGFLYDYYGVTEESTQAPPSPTNPSGGNGSPVHSSSSGHSDTEPASPVQSEQTTLSFLHAVQQMKTPTGTPLKSSDRLKLKPETQIPHKTSTPQAIQQVKIQPSQSSCSRAVLSRPSSYPPSSKGEPVTDTSPLTLSTSPTEAYNFGPYVSALKPQTVFSAQDKYSFSLEAPTSIVQRRGDDTLTYLNKGQFYAINFIGNVDPPSSEGELQRVKSVAHLVFRDEKDPRSEFDHWQYWHSQQPNPLQRAFDIDRKSCQNIQENVDEIAYNAAGFTWSPHLNAKIVIRINCLSTDFSSQKGVKGIPLHLQIDTYEDLTTDSEPVHRAFCQIKVFRDKGAERKNKDESKSAEKRMQKWMKQSSGSDTSHPSMISPNALFHPPSKYTILLSTTPLGPKPVLFMPTVRSSHGISNLEESTIQTSSLLATIREREHKRTLQSALVIAKDELADLDVSIPRAKAQKVHVPSRPAVTVYVKKEEEKVYNALMLDSLTVSELSEVVARKYGMPVDMIKNVYKKTKKGILVNMDDRMIEQFVDEDDFIINLDFDNQLGHFELTLKY